MMACREHARRALGFFRWLREPKGGARRRAAAMGVCLCLCSALAWPASDARFVTISNDSPEIVVAVSVKPDYEPSWGGDDVVVETVVIETNSERSLSLGRGDHCIYDVALVFKERDGTDGVAYSYERDICGGTRLPFRSVVVRNHSNETVRSLYVAAEGADNWGLDRLGSKTIDAGAELTLGLLGDDQCVLDVRVVGEDGLERILAHHDLCKRDPIAFGQSAPEPPVQEPPRDPTRTVGEVFRDCDGWNCPYMIVVEPGAFRRGSTTGRDNERPVRQVTIGKMFAVGESEVTVSQFKAFVRATAHDMRGGCQVRRGGRWRQSAEHHWETPPFEQNSGHPVVCVSWRDAQAYAAWLANETGRPYRLLSEAEWEYLAQSPLARDFRSSELAHCRGCGTRWDGKGTAPAANLGPDRRGLYDLFGNAWEWVADCYEHGYSAAPRDGSPWNPGACKDRVLRGGSWYSKPEELRTAYRQGRGESVRNATWGFRVARDLITASKSSSVGSSGDSNSIVRDRPAVRGEVVRQQPISTTQPEYPPAARIDGIEGHVTVSFGLTVSGRVQDAVVVSAQPADIFDAAALEAVRQFTFSPRTIGGVPVEVRGLRTRFRFELNK